MKVSESQRDEAVALFKSVQADLASPFERFDGKTKLEYKPWERPPTPSGLSSGGGTIGLMRGQVVEKAGANVSAVRGDLYPAIEGGTKTIPTSPPACRRSVT